MKKAQMISMINAKFDKDALMDYDQGSHLSRLRRELDFCIGSGVALEEMTRVLEEIDCALEIMHDALYSSTFEDYLESRGFRLEQWISDLDSSVYDIYRCAEVDKYIGTEYFATIVGYDEEEGKIIDEVRDFPFILSVFGDTSDMTPTSEDPRVFKFKVANENEFNDVLSFVYGDLEFMWEDDQMDEDILAMMINKDTYKSMLLP